MAKQASRYEQELLAQAVVGLLRAKNLIDKDWTQLWSKKLYDKSFTLLEAIDTVTDKIDAFDLVDEVRKLMCAELVTELGHEPLSYDENRSLLIAYNEQTLTERIGVKRLLDSTVVRLSERLEAVA